jgi:hypothetical protein
MGAWPCLKCGRMMFSFNLFEHYCQPSPSLEWDDEPREGSEPKAETERLGAEPAEPGGEAARQDDEKGE